MRLKTTLGRMLVVAAAVVAAGMLGATFQVSAREQAPEPPTLPIRLQRRPNPPRRVQPTSKRRR